MKIKTIADLDFDISLREIKSFEDVYVQIEDFAFYIKNTFNFRHRKIKKGTYIFSIPIENKQFYIISENNTLSYFIYLICLQLPKYLKIEGFKNKVPAFLYGFKRINDFEYEVILGG